VAGASAADVATAVLAGGTATVVPAGLPAEPVLIGADDVIVTQTPRAGWAVATEGGETVAIDITVSPELLREGLAREVIRLVQEARKNDGLEVTDRIWLRWSCSSSASPELAEALTEHAGLIAAEVLAVEFGPGGGAPAGAGAVADVGAGVEHVDAELGLTFWLGRSDGPGVPGAGGAGAR